MTPAERFLAEAPGGLLSYGDDGRIAMASSALCRMLGHEVGSLVGRTFESLMSPASRVYHSTHLFPLLKLKGAWEEVHLQLRTKDGRNVNVLASASHPPESAMSHCTLIPMEQRKQVESALVDAKQVAETANAAKDQFLAVISHELRSPLSAILGWAKLGQSNKIDPGILRQAFATIERNARLQVRLIDDLLDISRIVSGKMRLSPRATDLAPIIEAAIDTARLSAKAKDISLISSVDRTPHVVFADPDRIQQIAWNLLANALKFTPKGGRVQVTLLRVDSHVQFGVSDTGQGIAAEQLPFVFDRFWQADGLTQGGGGLGLGLAICRTLVELHGGTIRVASAGVDQGATFFVEIPLAVVSTNMLGKPVSRLADTAEPPLASSLRGMKVLVVDDDADIRDVMKALLDSAGAATAVADSFEQAVEHLRREVPDVVLSDIGLAGKDGYELIGEIRSGSIPGVRSVPAIAITGLSRPQDRVSLLRAGFQAHLGKPIEPAELVALISAIGKRLH